MSIPSVLKKRKDFVRISRSGFYVATQSLVLQASRKPEGRKSIVQEIGYTTTKKIGKATIRNRCRRRLRAVAALFFYELSSPANDYVLIARNTTDAADFQTICRDFKYAMKKINTAIDDESKKNAQKNHKEPLCLAD